MIKNMWEWSQKKNKGRKTILAAWGAKNNFHEKLVLCFVHLKSCLLFPGLLHPFASVCVCLCVKRLVQDFQKFLRLLVSLEKGPLKLHWLSF